MISASACPTRPKIVRELTRLWIHDKFPRNTASWFIARALRLYPPHIIVSYADTGIGHMGVVYRAANFHYAGCSAPCVEIIPDGAAQRRQAIRMRRRKTATGGREVLSTPKVRYWTVNGTKRQKRDLRRICAWPSLCWKENPPPVWTGKPPERTPPAQPEPQSAPLLDLL